MENLVEKLRLERFRCSTRKNYYAIWKIFNAFYLRLDRKPEFWKDHLTLFIAHLIKQNRQSSMIKSFILVIKAILREDGYKVTEDQYLLSSLTKACRIKNDSMRIHFPIQKVVLHMIIDEIDKQFGEQFYLRKLYRAMFLIAYYGLFRVGELICSEHVILAKNVHIAQNKKKLLIYLESSKTYNKGSIPQMVKIAAVNDKETRKNLTVSYKDYCPFNAIRDFIRIRKGFICKKEQFFVFCDRSPISAPQFRVILKKMLNKTGLQNNLYNCHSFRSGQSIDLLRMGISVKTILKLGRWSSKSNMVYKYLRYT